jgi:hypothetical protein
MTRLEVIGGVVGALMAFGYFGAFVRMIGWCMRTGHMGRATLVLLVAFRQLLLAAAVIGAWALGLPWPGLLVGVVVGAALYRLVLASGFPRVGKPADFAPGDPSIR